MCSHFLIYSNIPQHTPVWAKSSTMQCEVIDSANTGAMIPQKSFGMHVQKKSARILWVHCTWHVAIA